MNHPNRSKNHPSRNPKPAEVKAARETLQRKQLGPDDQQMGITAAQTFCAAKVHTTCRVWQQWEAGDRRMHPAFWELFNLKRYDVKRRKEVE